MTTDNLLTPENEAVGERPMNVPEKFWDAQNKRVRLDALANSYAALERKMSSSLPAPNSEEEKIRIQKALGMPETADDYCIECAHGMFKPDTEVNERLHAKGLTQEQIQEVYDLAAEKMVPMIAELAADFQADREVEKLVNHFGGPDAWKQVSKQLLAFGQQNLPREVFENLSGSYEGVLALYRMMKSDEPGMPKSTASVTSKADEMELQSMMRDPRYWKEKDPSFVAKVTDGFKTLYGE